MSSEYLFSYLHDSGPKWPHIQRVLALFSGRRNFISSGLRMILWQLCSPLQFTFWTAGGDMTSQKKHLFSLTKSLIVKLIPLFLKWDQLIFCHLDQLHVKIETLMKYFNMLCYGFISRLKYKSLNFTKWLTCTGLWRG